MTGERLKAWMEAARVSAQDIAEALSDSGNGVSRQRVHQWCNGAPVSEYWSGRLEQVIAEIDANDLRRVTSRITKEAAA